MAYEQENNNPEARGVSPADIDHHGTVPISIIRPPGFFKVARRRMRGSDLRQTHSGPDKQKEAQASHETGLVMKATDTPNNPINFDEPPVSSTEADTQELEPVMAEDESDTTRSGIPLTILLITVPLILTIAVIIAYLIS